MHPRIFFDAFSFMITAALVAAGIGIYFREPSRRDRLLAIGSFVQTISLGFGFFWAIRMLAVIDSPGDVGPQLAICLLTPLYGVLVKVSLVIYVRFRYFSTG